jgi:hypothetical protein
MNLERVNYPTTCGDCGLIGRMTTDWILLDGIVVPGHKIASGQAADGPYPAGALHMQKPFFRRYGLELDAYYEGTLNISIRPFTFKMVKPQFTFPLVEWTSLHPPETFSFSSCRIFYENTFYSGWVYYPHPETKQTHFQDAGVVEVITNRLNGMHYGAALQVALNPAEIDIIDPQ